MIYGQGWWLEIPNLHTGGEGGSVSGTLRIGVEWSGAFEWQKFQAPQKAPSFSAAIWSK